MSVRADVEARRFDQRIQILRQDATTQDSYGQPLAGWPILVECWAAVDAVQPRRLEPYFAQEVLPLTRYTAWVRADIVSRYSVTAGDRIRWRDELYDIKDVLDQQLRGRLTALIIQGGLIRE